MNPGFRFAARTSDPQRTEKNHRNTNHRNTKELLKKRIGLFQKLLLALWMKGLSVGYPISDIRQAFLLSDQDSFSCACMRPREPPFSRAYRITPAMREPPAVDTRKGTI